MKNDSNLNYIKNKFRGIVATYKSKKFRKDKKLTDTAVFRQNLKSLLVESRALFPESKFNDVLQWIDTNTKSQLPQLSYRPVGLEELRFVRPEVKEVSLDTELLWISCRLATVAKSLNTFLNYKTQVEHQVMTGRYSEAIDILQQKERHLGSSLWSVKLRIALLQTEKGLESQKQYTTQIRNIWTGNVVSYIALFTSIRNEERTTIGKYFDDMELRFNGPNVDEELVPHLKYHLLSELPKNEKSIKDFLIMEQMGTIYDLYESLTVILLECADFNHVNISSEIKNKVLTNLKEVSDPRLAKLSALQGNEPIRSIIRTRNTQVSDSVICNETANVITLFKSLSRYDSNLDDVWSYVYLGIWLSAQGKDYYGKISEPHRLATLLGKALSANNMLSEVNTLIKLSINYHDLSIFKGIKELLLFLLRKDPDYVELWSPHRIGLHSNLIGVEDIPLCSSIDLPINLVDSSIEALWRDKDKTNKISADHLTICMFKALRSLSSDKPEDCISSLPSHISVEIPFPYRLIFTQAKLYALSQERLRGKIIHLINETAPESNNIIDMVSFEDELVDYEYEDFNCNSSSLSAPIAIYIAWLKTDDSRLLSYLRIATKQALRKLGVERPSKIETKANTHSKSQLIFFLDNICAPQVIDGIKALKGTKAVLNERQDICQLLIDLDPTRSRDYKLEIESIDDDLSMEEGKRLVDRTRIYVDMDAHSRWMLRELKEDYERYKDLLNISIKGEQNYHEIVNEFLTADGITKTTFLPENEADAVLLSIIAKASNNFLTNPKYGLDYYLSKRIRHQSFIGLIRSHLEFSNLITTRVSEGDAFEYNHYWVGKFHCLNQKQKDELNGLMSEFAEEFDDQLIYVRDNIFQLNTEECPSGLIKTDFNIHVMSLLKHFIIETDASFEQFVYYSNVFMWAFLQPSLEKTKIYIQSTLKPTIMHNSDRLKGNARKLAGSDPAFDDFELKLTDQIAAVQRSLEDVMSWFTPLTGVSAESVIISVDKALSLSIKAALDMLKPFRPKLSKHITNTGDIKLNQQGLTFLNDTVFILLDNIKAHSGLKSPEVDLHINICDAGETITIICSNSTKQSERGRLQVEIAKIRTFIEKGKIGDRARLEGRSGFIKLAASIDKAQKGYLDFKLMDSGNFTLTITNDIKIESIPLEDVSMEDV